MSDTGRFGSVRLASDSTPPSCSRCRHFDNRPAHLERAIPGLRVMGSGYSAVKAQDGLCTHHDRYLSDRYVCDDFSARDQYQEADTAH